MPAPVFGRASTSNASNSSNPIASDRLGTSNFPSFSTQGSVFGANATNIFGTSSSFPSPTFSFRQAYGNTNSHQNPFASNAFGNTSNPNHTPFGPNSFGDTSNSNHNPFGSNACGNSSNSNHNSFAPNAFGKTSNSNNNAFGDTSNSNHNPFAPNAFGNTSNSNHNPFAPNAFGNSSNTNSNSFGRNALENASKPNHSLFAPYSFGKTSNTNHNPSTANAYWTTASFHGGLSTGVFRASSASSSSTFTFRQPATSFESSSMFGTSSIMSQGPFGSTTSGGLFGGSSSSVFKQGSGSFASLLTPTTRSLTGGTSTRELETPSLLTSPPFLSQNSGSRINPYKRTSEGPEWLMSISAMPCYKCKSHEELRWEDYVLKSGGHSVSNQEIGINKPEFNFSLPSTTSSLSTCRSPFEVSLFSTYMNTPTLSIPALSSPNPSPNYSALHAISPSSTGPGINKEKPDFSFPSIKSTLSTQSPPFTFPSISTNMNTPTLSFPSLSSPNPSPNFPAILTKSTSSSTGPGCEQLGAGSLYNQPLQNLSLPSTRSGLGQAPSPLITLPVPAENYGGASLNIDQSQPSHPQQISVMGGVKHSIIAVKDPFGSERTTLQPSIGHSACSSLVQHGISSMPVAEDKPAKTRVSSVLTSRHRWLKPLAVNVRKYHPSKDVPKVPFFDRAEDIQISSKAYSYIVPRENSRSVFAASSELIDVSTSKKEESPPNHGSAEEYEQVSGNVKKDQISSLPPNFLNDHSCESKDNAKEVNKILVPKLKQSDYYTQPKIEKLASMECINPGFCCHVKDFVVGRHGYGWVKFDGETDVRGLDLDSIIHFHNREVIVYDEDSEKPPVGQGLNKAAEVTLLDIKCNDKKTGKEYTSDKMVGNFVKKLKKVTEKQGAEFISYDSIKEEWKFRVQHF